MAGNGNDNEDKTMTVVEAVLEQAVRIQRISVDRMQGMQGVALRAFVAGLLGSLVIAGPFALHLATSAALSRKLARRLAHRFGSQVRIDEVSPLGLLHPGLQISGLAMTWNATGGGVSALDSASTPRAVITRSVEGRLVAPMVELRISPVTRHLSRVRFHHVWIQGRPEALLRRIEGNRTGRQNARLDRLTSVASKSWLLRGRSRFGPTIVFDKGGFLMTARSGLRVFGEIEHVVLSLRGRSLLMTGKAVIAVHRDDVQAMGVLAGRVFVTAGSSNRRFVDSISSGRGRRWVRWASEHLSVRNLVASKITVSWSDGLTGRATWAGRARVVELTHGLTMLDARLGQGANSAVSLQVIADLARQRYEVRSRAHGIDADELNRRLTALMSATKSSRHTIVRGVDLHGAALAWNIAGRLQPGVKSMTGTVHLAGPVTVTKRWLSSRSVTWRRLDVTATGGVRNEQGGLVVDLNKVRFHNQGMAMGFVGRISRHNGVIQGVLRARLPQTDCQRLLTSLPTGLAPALDGMVLSGRVGADLLLSARSDHLSDLVLRTGLMGPGCKVVRDPERGDVHRLLAEHSISARDRNGRPMRWVIGPSNRAFRPLTILPHHLVRAFMMTEDRRFFRHRGFDWGQIRRALAFDLEHGSLLKGASTISQQVVKNEFLTQHKTFARKIQEAVLTWRLEQVVPKSRILELYLNLVEMGPGIYGVARGARTYFGRDVRSITPMQSLHLAAITPSPRRYYRDFRGGRIHMAWLLRLKSLLHRMLRSGLITEPEYAKSNSQKFYLASF